MDTTPTQAPQSGFKKFLFFLKFLEIRLRFVAVLVITALLVGYWDTIQNYYERWTRSGPVKEQASSDTEFFCPMHPFVVRDTFGKCPICSMDLVLRKKGATVKLPEGVLTRVQVSPERIMQAGVQVEPVAYRLLSRTIRSYGVVETDETRVARINARFPGRVEEMLVNATGVDVKKGDPLVRIYSPKYLSASFEYLQALESRKKTAADSKATPEAKKAADDMAEITRKPLERQGFTKEQLDEMERTGKATDRITFYSPVSGTIMEKNAVVGDNVDESMTLYTVADLSTVWVQAQVIESDIGAVKKGMPVTISTVSESSAELFGNVDLIYPTVNQDNRSVKVRIIALNKQGKLKPGMYVTATIRASLGRFGEIGSPNEPKVDLEASASMKKEAVSDSYPLETCPVSGEKLGGMGEPVNVEVEGRKVKLCCAGCVDKLKSNPKKFLAVLDDAMTKANKTKMAGGSEQPWVEGYTCEMHPDKLLQTGGVCPFCDCGMQLTRWRVERVLSIPETAVVDTGLRKIVYVENAPGVYDARAVTLGPRAGNYYPIVRGLSIGQKVVGKGSFLIDAEARLNPGATNDLNAEPTPEAETKMPADPMVKMEKDAGPFKVSLTTVPAELKAGETAFEVTVMREGKPVSNATVSIKLSMPTMPGMKVTEIKLAGVNSNYKGSGSLGMGGEWEIQVNVKSEAGEGSASFKTTVRD